MTIQALGYNTHFYCTKLDTLFHFSNATIIGLNFHNCGAAEGNLLALTSLPTLYFVRGLIEELHLLLGAIVGDYLTFENCCIPTIILHTEL